MAENCTTMALDMRTVPRRWMKFIQRVARLEAGKAYRITIFMPKERDAEPTWTRPEDLGYIENQK